MNILYIYGWDSSPESNTVKDLRPLLSSYNITSVEYDQTNPIEAVKFFNQYIVDNHINAVIASSFGAFIGINIGHSVYKFLINPCLMPSLEVPKFNMTSHDFVAQCQQMENNPKIVDDEDIRFTTAFFSDHDELFNYKNKYFDLGYFKYMDIINEYHQLSYEGLRKVTEKISISLR